jgi:hypothetical protein
MLFLSSNLLHFFRNLSAFRLTGQWPPARWNGREARHRYSRRTSSSLPAATSSAAFALTTRHLCRFMCLLSISISPALRYSQKRRPAQHHRLRSPENRWQSPGGQLREKNHEPHRPHERIEEGSADYTD